MIIGIPRETRPVRDARRRHARDRQEARRERQARASWSRPAPASCRAFPTRDFAAAGARIGDAAEALGADIVLKVRGPSAEELPQLKRGAMLIGLLESVRRGRAWPVRGAGVSGFALE